MAQKASKTLAARNTSLLFQTHITTLCLHAIFLLLHYLFNRPSSLGAYATFTAPTMFIEFYLERLGRPKYNTPEGALRSPGEDLGAPGMTEYMWDVLYWTWGCMGAVCVFGDRAWWLWVVVPLYSVWSAWTAFRGMRNGLSGMGGGGEESSGGAAAESKRQKKLEKRGGQRVQYR